MKVWSTACCLKQTATPLAFPDVRNCALGPSNPKRESDLALNPHRSVSSQAGSLLKKKTESVFFQRKRKNERKSGYRF